MKNDTAIVLLSGGLDSLVSLDIAAKKFDIDSDRILSPTLSTKNLLTNKQITTINENNMNLLRIYELIVCFFKFVPQPSDSFN